jgi:hypothetical protein
MTDYTKNANFAAKTGTTIEGADFDAEFDEIATAIASKENVANKNAPLGYAGLDGAGLLPAANSPVASESARGAVELATTGEAAAGSDTARAVTPAGLTAWASQNAGIVNDLAAIADPNADVLFFWDDSAGTALPLTLGTGLSITGTTLNAAAGNDASALTTGTIPDARIQASGVTQHQASLTILESQITDGSILARVGSNETITGAWTLGNVTFNGTLTKASKGGVPYYDSSTQSGGAITVSTSAASGTPAAGDLWFQYTP